jgi:predicted RND superfamily exporter protein
LSLTNRGQGAAAEPGPRVRAYVRFVLRHGKKLWLLAALLAVPAMVRAAGLYLRLQSDIEELLPRGAPSVVALDELRARLPGLRYLGIVIDTGTPDNLPAAERFIDDLSARVSAYPKSLVARVKTGVEEERRFLEQHAPLYMDLADLQTIQNRLEARRDAEVLRAFGGDFDDPPEADKPDFGDVEAKYHAQQKQAARLEGGRFSNREKKLALMVIQVAEFTTGASLGNALYARVTSDIKALGGLDRYAPGMRLGFAGDIAIDVEELAALVQDLTASSIVVIGLVLALIVVFYRWPASVPALLLPLFIGATFAFALVTLPPIGIEHLNANTAFLGSVIVGNGINFGIIFLARYVEERRGGRDVEEALVYAVFGSRTGTFVASAAAAAAYGSLAITQFRGFRQFGIIGGVAMVICWITAFVLGPPLVAWLDAKGSSRRKKDAQGLSIMDRAAALVTRHPAAIVTGALLITALSIVRTRTFDRSWIEYDFSRLRRADSHISGEGYWGRRMDDLLGRYLTPLVMLTDSADERRRLEHLLESAVQQPPLVDAVASVVSIDDLVPGQQAEKIQVAEAIRKDLTPRILSRLTDAQREVVEPFVQGEPLHPIGYPDLPPTMTSGLRERDGSFERAVLIYPRPSSATWQGEAIVRLTGTLRKVAVEAAHPGERPARLAGSIPLSADIISSIEHDAPLATAASLLGVTLLVALTLRHKRAVPLVIGSLLLGVLWLLAAVMTLRVKINFANFIAFPITFGIGVDYAVNVMARYLEQGSKNVVAAIRSTGGAVTLCSLTTITGYSSLLFAQNRALFLFGVVAVLGEVACLLTAILVLPSVLLLLGRPSRPERAALAGASRP